METYLERVSWELIDDLINFMAARKKGRHFFMFRFALLLACFCCFLICGYCQPGSNWLLGYQDSTDQYTTTARARITFGGGNFVIVPEVRKMNFMDTQGTISDSLGNLIMSSNGIWIADATGDTMQNGFGLNPGMFTSDYSNGLPIANGNIFLPYPGNAMRYVLFHMTGDYNLMGRASSLYYSVVDMTQNGGLGAVIQKNSLAFQDTLSWGIGACRHANGRDWWIVVLKDSSDLIFKVLFTPSGVFNVTAQAVGSPINYFGNTTQPTFSPDGSKFAYCSSYGPTPWYADVRVFSFDRCSGDFTNYNAIPINDSHPAFGLAFSPNSKYLYATSTYHIVQINTDTTDMSASLDSVASNDGFYSPVPPFLANFWLMYLASDGKIYLTAGNSVVDLHCIHDPNLEGTGCNVGQHAIHLPCYHSRSVPNHTNYFLSSVSGSLCDSLFLQIPSLESTRVMVFPNPASNHLNIRFSQPLNLEGTLLFYNGEGKCVRHIVLHRGSSGEYIDVRELKAGIYNLLIIAGDRINLRFCIHE